MVGGHNQAMERENLAEGSTSVEATKREDNNRAGTDEGQAKGGYSSLDLGGEDPRVSHVPSFNSDCSTLAPKPPPKRRPPGGKNFRQKFQSAPLPDTRKEPQQDDFAPTRQDDFALKTDSAEPISQTSGRAPSRFRARIVRAQVQQHRSEPLENFQAVDCLSEVGETMLELADTDGEESD
eukprot:TRINITY_DN16644_c0_g2_i1.p1 TRINITY_DN16644_c0_g2~~TRINITY_DN16644_c0_g2_i1.p1  ORF type:complete len:205 (+),score=26.56 TRINITY_DN16644_c0_g2_i1:76-615(+)